MDEDNFVINCPNKDKLTEEVKDVLNKVLSEKNPGVRALLEIIEDADYGFIYIKNGKIFEINTTATELPDEKTFPGESLEYLSAEELEKPINLARFPNLNEVWINDSFQSIFNYKKINKTNKHNFEYVGGKIRKAKKPKKNTEEGNIKKTLRHIENILFRQVF